MAGAPPPPVVPVADVEAARTAAATARQRIEATLSRAATYAEEDLQRGVDGEWSTVQSLRHIVLVIDLWLSRTIGGERDPFHPMALPPSFMPPKLFPDCSIDPDAEPTFEEAATVVRQRLEALDRYVDTLTSNEGELERAIESHARTVGGGLSVIFNELSAHDRFINRDLDQL